MVRVVGVYRRKRRSLPDRLLRRSHWGRRDDVETLAREMARQRETRARETYERIRRTMLTDIISPTSVQCEKDYIRVDDKYCRVLAVTGFPAEVEPGWMQDLTRFSGTEGEVTVVQFIDPIPKREAQRMLESEFIKVETEREKARLEGIPGDRTADVVKKTLAEDIRQIALGREKLFFFSLYIMVEARSLQALDLLTKRIVNKLDGLSMAAAPCYMRMHEGLQSVLPAGIDVLRIRKALTTSALAACNLFYDTGLPMESSGVLFGFTEDGVPVIVDPFGPGFPNANGLVLAGSGSGKSFFVKLYAIRQLLMGADILIVDPSQEGEYRDVTKAQRGSWIPISHGSEAVINVFDLFGGSLRDKLLSLKAISRFLIPDLSEAQAAMLGECYVEIYRARGITDDPRTWGYDPPTLGDAYRWLQAKAEESRASKDSESLKTASALLRRFKEFTEGTYRFLDQQSNIPGLDNRLVTFYLGGLDAELRPLFSFLVMDYIYKRMQRDEKRKRKVLIMDEVWDLLRNRVASEYILRIVRTCRHHNLGLVLISQLVNDFLRDETGEAVMANTSWKLLLRQEDAAADMVKRSFHLPQEDVDWLVGIPSPKQLGYSLGMFVLGRQRVRMKIYAAPYEHELVTTNPEELRRASEALEKEKRAREEQARVRMRRFDINRGLFRLSELTDSEVKVLEEAGYRRAFGPTLGRGRGEYYMIRPPSGANQSPKHYITVKLLEEVIREYTDRVELYDVRWPDIVFTTQDGRRIAVEIETGSNLKKGRKVLEEKLEILRAYDDWFFVCDDKDKQAYSNWGPAYNRSEAVSKIQEYFL
jgi:hypothetical protein